MIFNKYAKAFLLKVLFLPLQSMEEKKKIAFYTLGCKLNFSETSQISRQFDTNKFEIVDFKQIADIYVINTCIVTEKAEKKSRSAIRQAKKRNPDAIIAAVGCYSELKPEELSEAKETDVVLGTSSKFTLPEVLNNLNSNQLTGYIDSNLNKKFISSYSSGDRTRSFFKIQDGCDYFCSYCTVPFARGRSRSDTIENTLTKACEIASYGIKELILTGVNVGDYGRKNGENFIDLLKKLDQIEGIERIRISSIEPDLLTNDIIEFVASSKKFLPHFHIPLQSASDKILLSMKRKYDTPLFSEKIKLIKKYMPDCCIAIDLIVGFPGETKECFEESYRFIEASTISYLHVFTYSERENTLAAGMNETVPHIERTIRSKKMLALSEKKKNIFYAENSGKEKYVLFESDNDKGLMYGFTENYIKVKTAFNPSLINHIKKVKLGKIGSDGIFPV